MSEQTYTPGDLADELESGKWRKGRGQLGREAGHRCCLGVASELAGIDLTVDQDGYREYGSLRMDKPLPNELDPSAVNHFTRVFPWLHADTQQELANLNDDHPGWDEVISYLRHLDKVRSER